MIPPKKIVLLISLLLPLVSGCGEKQNYKESDYSNVLNKKYSIINL